MLKYLKKYRSKGVLRIDNTTSKWSIGKLRVLSIDDKEEVHLLRMDDEQKIVITFYTAVAKFGGLFSSVLNKKKLITVGVVSKEEAGEIVHEPVLIRGGIYKLKEVLDTISNATKQRYKLNGVEINPSLDSTFVSSTSLPGEELRGHVYFKQ